MAPHDGHESSHDGEHRHHNRPHSQGGTFLYGLVEVLATELFPVLGTEPSVRLVQINQQHHPDLRRHSGQGYEPYPCCHTHVVTQEIHQPKTTCEGERHAQHNNQTFADVLEIEIEEEKYDNESHRYDDHQSLLCPHHVLILTAPHHAVAWWQLYLLPHNFLSHLHIGAHIYAF